MMTGVWKASKARCFQFVGDVTCHVQTSQKIVALSFDDGPTPGGVDAAMEMLRAHRVKATFFLIGKMVARNPGLAKQMAAAGHEIGNHSFSHRWMVGKLPSTYDDEITRTHKLLVAEGVPAPTLFRPPFGKKLIGLPIAIQRNGYQSIMWDVEDDLDDNFTPRKNADHILSQVRPGSIILMHTMYKGNKAARDALPLVLDGLKARGFRVVTVGALLALR
jgi:peptidoglycan-N-acetylglucosamine deacetylase